MVRVCAFPNCGNKMKRYLCLSFHRLPYRNRETLQLWLAALQLDVKTPLRTLREKDYRVCSEHFDEDDFTEKSVKSRYLKANAIPKAKRTAAEKLLHGTWAGMDQSPGQVRSTGIQANVPETSTATMEKPTLQHIVDEEAILQLMKNCPMCNRNCRCTKRFRSPYFIVYQSCYYCNYQRKWANQPEARNMDIPRRDE
ncbi:THAP domain-containing protein 4-like [Perca flavescens]|uniref:THAP domain-containing protein 4-like n=1 Tax=Perca flavescens TaxID=8167 RepID=UPI00106EF971|nr:THAP domain-containing protein 4-like [Perca flavescens]